MDALTLACGPFIDLDDVNLWMSVIVFLILKPVAYFGFIQAFRYRVSRPIPMTLWRAARLTLARAGLGVLIFLIGAVVVISTGSDLLLAWSWFYLYLGRVAAWFIVGWSGAVLRGRRLVGWIISGTLINAAFDFAALAGLFDGWIYSSLVLLGLCVFVALLHRIGRRATLKARFTSNPVCLQCQYDLTGNLSGRCPECAAPIAESA